MKSQNYIIAIVRVASITLLAITCYCICGYAADARKNPYTILTTARARADFLENPKRIEVFQPDRILDVLGVKSGEVVADVGCGTGAFTFRMADKVGKDGKVYAVDILDEMLLSVDTKMQKYNVSNIVLVKSSEVSPNLPPASCDKIILIDTYQYIRNKVSFFGKLRQSLRDNGTVAIISFVPRQTPLVTRDMEKLGFKFKAKYDFIVDHYFLVFTKN
jgi:ubiquinone/menaquinone biosynthesis C-methylase UbiE